MSKGATPRDVAARKRVLLTGGLGFIGSHVAERLIRRGDVVTIIDNLNTFYDPLQKKSNVKFLEKVAQETAKPSALDIVILDIRDLAKIKDVFESFQPEVVCHIAGQGGVKYSIDNPVDSVGCNVTGTTVMLEAARVCRSVKCFVMAGSSGVYGQTAKAPFREDERCEQPIAPYGATKRACEHICHSYYHLYNLPCTTLRLFSVYGPRGRPDMLPYLLIDLASRGAEFKKRGDGTQLRDYTYVGDVADGFVAAVDRAENLGFAVMNLGGSDPQLVNTLIENVEKHVGKKLHVSAVIELQEGDPQEVSADNSQAKELLGFSPKVSLDHGICETVKWYRAYQEEKKSMTEPQVAGRCCW